jgi:peptidoglycan hydrolase-like protein with peptidoglycan-binding domain
VRLRLVAVFAVAGVVLLAGCGSGGTKSGTPPSSPQHTTSVSTRPSAKPTGTAAAHAKRSTGSGAHQVVLAWIRRLQRDLTTLHFYSGPVTGIETVATKKAVIRFQKAAHLKADGLWGSKSQAALNKMLGRKPAKPPRALGWIRKLQRDLTTLHVYAGPITGVETTATKIAVIRFQKAAHLKADGLWGSKSQAALDKMLGRKP